MLLAFALSVITVITATASDPVLGDLQTSQITATTLSDSDSSPETEFAVCEGVIANDDLCEPTYIRAEVRTLRQVFVPYDTFSGTMEEGEPDNGDYSTWYTFEPNYDGTINVANVVGGPGQDNLLIEFTLLQAENNFKNCGDSGELDWSDLEVVASGSSLEVPVENKVWYYLRLSNVQACGEFAIQLIPDVVDDSVLEGDSDSSATQFDHCTGAAVNDNACEATTLTGELKADFWSLLPFDLHNTTIEDDETNAGEHSAWFYFKTPAGCNFVSLFPLGLSSSDVYFTLFRGEKMGRVCVDGDTYWDELDLLGQFDATIKFDVVAKKYYWLRVDGSEICGNAALICYQNMDDPVALDVFAL